MKEQNLTLPYKPHQKGFSLIELLIVIAIMGVLAVIAFNAFNGVLQNSKIRADEQQANNIVKSIRMLITETNIADIVGQDDKFFKKSVPDPTETWKFSADDGSGTAGVGKTAVQNLIIALQNIIYVQDNVSSIVKAYGPYLTNPTGGTANAMPYWSQWNANNGGNHTGYVFEISTGSYNVRGLPVKGASGTALSFSGSSGPGIRIIP